MIAAGLPLAIALICGSFFVLGYLCGLARRDGLDAADDILVDELFADVMGTLGDVGAHLKLIRGDRRDLELFDWSVWDPSLIREGDE